MHKYYNNMRSGHLLLGSLLMYVVASKGNMQIKTTFALIVQEHF